MAFQEWSPTKKGAAIGSLISIFFITTAVIGTFTCNWNPIEGSVIHGPVCKNILIMSIFYFSAFLFPLYPLIGAGVGKAYETLFSHERQE